MQIYTTLWSKNKYVKCAGSERLARRQLISWRTGEMLMVRYHVSTSLPVQLSCSANDQGLTGYYLWSPDDLFIQLLSFIQFLFNVKHRILGQSGNCSKGWKGTFGRRIGAIENKLPHLHSAPQAKKTAILRRRRYLLIWPTWHRGKYFFHCFGHSYLKCMIFQLYFAYYPQ